MEKSSDNPDILMIDDDPMIQRLFGDKLTKAGFEIVFSSDVLSANETAKKLQPKLILLDIRMPNGGGYKLAQSLKKDEATKNIPIAFLSNEDLSREGEKWARELWVEDYIHKSIDLKDLVVRVKKLITDPPKPKSLADLRNKSLAEI